MTLTAVVLMLLIGPTFKTSADYPFGTTRLSEATSVCDIEPRSDSTDDGQWLGTVWIERDQGTGGGCQTGGQAVVRWATEGAQYTTWQGPVRLPLPTLTACAVHADIALSGSTGHVAVSYWDNCTNQNTDSRVRYYTCDFTTGECFFRNDVALRSGPSFPYPRLSDVRITVGGDGRPHVVFAQGETGLLTNGSIWYARGTGVGWASAVLVSIGSPFNGAYLPMIAESQGRLHVVWEQHRSYVNDSGQPFQYGDVRYRYCDTSTSACYPETFAIAYQHPDPSLRDATYPRLSIDARGDTVMFVWNICADVDLDRPCENFRLLYAGSTNNGTTLSPTPREVGGANLELKYIDFSSVPLIPGSDSWPTLVSSYASHARPSVTLDDAGLPHVAWHVETASGYVISTTYATGGGLGSYQWASGSQWQIGDGSDARIAPTIIDVDDSLDGEDALHAFLMHAWQEDIGGQSVARSQVYYDYLGDRRPTLIAEPGPGSLALPQQRATQLRVQARDAGGSPVPNHPVAFVTDHGSFSYLGYGLDVQSAMTDDQGWATVTLYSNLAGGAQVEAWLDLTTNGLREVGEPAVYLDRAWTSNVMPELIVRELQVTAGDLITATLLEHPFESAIQPGQPVPYALWWCPNAGAQGYTQHLLGPLNVDVEQWRYLDALLEVPVDADGTYYLETRSNSEASPCTTTDRMARSVNISVSPAPVPTQDPQLTISDNQPGVGTSITVGVHNHPSASYGIWWCPANGQAAPVAQHLATVAVPGTGEATVPVRVPSGVSGLYRIESHSTGGSCGNPGTYQCSSPLLAPASSVFLPLVSRGN